MRDSGVNQLLVITDLPRWILKWVDAGLVILATLTGHSVYSSVREAGNDEP